MAGQSSPTYVCNREKTSTRSIYTQEASSPDMHSHRYTQLLTVAGSAAPVDCCIFANVKLVTVNNNKDETDSKSINSLTNALSALELGRT